MLARVVFLIRSVSHRTDWVEYSWLVILTVVTHSAINRMGTGKVVQVVQGRGVLYRRRKNVVRKIIKFWQGCVALPLGSSKTELVINSGSASSSHLTLLCSLGYSCTLSFHSTHVSSSNQPYGAAIASGPHPKSSPLSASWLLLT